MGKYHIAGASGKAICGAFNPRRQVLAVPAKVFGSLHDSSKCEKCVAKIKDKTSLA